MSNELTHPAELSTWERFKADPERSMDAVATAMAEGESVRGLARQLGVNNWTLFNWLNETPERQQRYARACEARAAFYADEIERIHAEPLRRTDKGNIDPADVAHKRLKLDALKWTASKLAPKRYGEKVEVDAKVTHDVVGELRQLVSGSRLPIRSRT